MATRKFPLVRILIITMICAGSYNCTQAQCISGNCDDGKGKAKYYTGTYTGEFRESLPHGKGVFEGIIQTFVGEDTIVDAGIFFDGMFVFGKRTIVTSVHKYPNNGYHQQFLGKYPLVNGFFRVSGGEAVVTKDFPGKASDNFFVNGKSKNLKGYSYEYLYSGTRMVWFGDLKNGLMHGDGILILSGNEYRAKFENGKPVDKAFAGTNNETAYKTIFFENGTISGTKLINDTKDTLVRKFTHSLFYFREGELNSGETSVRYSDKLVYDGDLLMGKRNGFGVFKDPQGNSFEGYFYNNMAHGEGKATKNGVVQQSGFYLYNTLAKGKYLQNDQLLDYPFCVSGDCVNGFGRANYSTSANKSDVNGYEGNFVNGLRSGYGVFTYESGSTKEKKIGNFNSGRLHGEAIIEANYGEIKKITGRFNNDTLLNGTISYADGSEFVADKIKPLVFGIHKEKNVNGFGTYYTKTGSVVKGQFYEGEKNMVWRADYRRADGVTIEFVANGNDLSKQLRIPYSYDVDQLDNMASLITAKQAQIQANLFRQQQLYKAEEEKRKKQILASNDPKNWVDKSRYEICSSCNGEGEIAYTNSFGGGTTATIVNSRGEIVGGGDIKSSRSYTRKVTCSACKGEKRIYLNNKVYTGPVY